MSAAPITSTASTQARPHRGLVARVLGVFVSPRATYADVASDPRTLGALVVLIVVIAGSTFAFLSTEIGQRALVDQQLSTMESFGVKVTDQMMINLESGAARGAYFSLAATAVFLPVVMALMAGIGLVVFNAGLGGEASFKQVYAIVVHSGFIGGLQTVFAMPLHYARESMSGATSLLAFLPMVDEKSFLGLLCGAIDFFRLWSILSLAVGLGVLYKKRTAPIAWCLLAVYGLFALASAGVRTAFSRG